MNTTSDQPVKCHRCGRILRAEASKRRLYGRGCWTLMRAAAMAEAVRGFASAQVEKARELISDGGLIPTSRPGVFRAVSSKGDGTYLVSTKGICGCAGGHRGMKAFRCYHAIGARILVASGKTA